MSHNITFHEELAGWECRQSDGFQESLVKLRDLSLAQTTFAHGKLSEGSGTVHRIEMTPSCCIAVAEAPPPHLLTLVKEESRVQRHQCSNE